MSRHMAPLLWVTHVNMVENIIIKIPVDVWVVDSCSEGKFWWFKGVIWKGERISKCFTQCVSIFKSLEGTDINLLYTCGEVDVEEEDTTFKGGVGRT